LIGLGPTDPCLQSLLGLLRDPRSVHGVSLADWDKIIRLARQARLLGVLAHRIQSQAECPEKVPDCVLGHLRSATAYSEHRVQMLRMELAALAKALPVELP
jgi:hypothetical protein